MTRAVKMTGPIGVATADGIQTITLARPQVFNAFDDEMGSSFLQALKGAEDEAVRAVVITGEGKAFCAGEDLKALAADYADGKAPDLGDTLRRRYNPAMMRIRSLKKPVIAAINGIAAGAGVSLALACDLRIMSVEASFNLAFAKVGLVPDSGATWLLPRFIGIGKALELALLSEPLTAPMALEMGLVNRVVPASDVAQAAMQLASELAAGPTVAFGLIKKLMWESLETSFDDHLSSEAQAQFVAGSSDDHLEGVRAFGERRPPRFSGT